MARKEARIYANIWEDSDFLALSRSAQGTYFFLLSQRDLTHAGIIPLRERRWVGKSATTDTAGLQHDLKELEAARFVVIDWDTEELLVRSLMRQDKVYLQPNVMLAAVDSVSPIASPLLVASLFVELERIESEQLSTAQETSVVKMRQALTKRLNELGGYQPVRGTENPSGIPSAKTSENLPGERGVLEGVSTDSPFPVPRSPGDVEPPPPKAKRGTRIPDDFAITVEMRRWAAAKALQVDIDLHTLKFVNYWQSRADKLATKLSWEKTWQNWMLDEHEKATRYSARASPLPIGDSPGYQLFNPDDHD
jgi:hypothetical protein